MNQLIWLLPYYTPHRGQLITGLLLVVVSTAALSAVDTHTEAEILRELRSGLHARTAIIASHRVSAIHDASGIIVVDDGHVVEQGRHDELMMTEGRYWPLLRRQQLVEAIEGADEIDVISPVEVDA